MVLTTLLSMFCTSNKTGLCILPKLCTVCNVQCTVAYKYAVQKYCTALYKCSSMLKINLFAQPQQSCDHRATLRKKHETNFSKTGTDIHTHTQSGELTSSASKKGSHIKCYTLISLLHLFYKPS